MNEIPPMDSLLEAAVAAFPVLFAGSHASILLREEDGKYHIHATSADHLKQRILDRTLIPYKAGEGKTGEVIATGRTVLYVDDKGLTSAKSMHQCESVKPATSFIAAPLLDAEGNVRGVIRSSRSAPAPAFTHAELDLLEQFATLVAEKINICKDYEDTVQEFHVVLAQAKEILSQQPSKGEQGAGSNEEVAGDAQIN
jgi:GAF domain-containing protein